MNKLFIGTSGWVYPHWENNFYPTSLSSKNKLKYYSQQFKTVEVNYSFYRLPSQKTFEDWAGLGVKDFIFALKANRFITHIKILKGVKTAWQTFWHRAQILGQNLGPILIQLPPNFVFNQENQKRLENFLHLINQEKGKFAFEFRHNSWLEKIPYKLLEKYNASWVIADSPNFPKAEILSADFVYLRFHGGKKLFSSNYTSKELEEWAKKIKKWLKTRDVYVYFNNDAQGFAPKNAKQLLKYF